jgi:hypothetical protein
MGQAAGAARPTAAAVRALLPRLRRPLRRGRARSGSSPARAKARGRCRHAAGRPRDRPRRRRSCGEAPSARESTPSSAPSLPGPLPEGVSRGGPRRPARGGRFHPVGLDNASVERVIDSVRAGDQLQVWPRALEASCQLDEPSVRDPGLAVLEQRPRLVAPRTRASSGAAARISRLVWTVSEWSRHIRGR